MKLTKNGLALLSGIVRSCMAKRAENCSDDQLIISTEPKMISLDKFRQIFPLEAGTAERLVNFTKALKKETIDEETVALFFGGEEHIRYAINNIREQGVKNGIAKLLLVFHMLVPVKILKEKDGAYYGLYNNQGIEIFFRNIQSVLCGDAKLAIGQFVFVHYGYVIRAAGKKRCETVLDEQSNSNKFIEACMRTATIDCGKLLAAFQPMRKR
jgi:hydrogenase maturation factor